MTKVLNPDAVALRWRQILFGGILGGAAGLFLGLSGSDQMDSTARTFAIVAAGLGLGIAGSALAPLTVRDREHLERRRARYAMVLAAFVLVWTVMTTLMLIADGDGSASSLTKHFSTAELFLLGVALAIFVSFGRVGRPPVDDELSATHRLKAEAWGFWTAMPVIVAFGVCATTAPHLAPRLVLAAVALPLTVALARIGWLEWRSE